VLVRYLTLGSGYCPTDPTVNPLISPADLGIPRTMCDYTETFGYVKPCQNFFLRFFLSRVKALWETGPLAIRVRPTPVMRML